MPSIDKFECNKCGFALPEGVEDICISKRIMVED